MADIKFFLKFGERRYLERLKEGHLYFSNARTFRRYEEELLIKGQGDRLEGGSYIIASNITMIDRQTGEPAFTGIKGNMIVHYAPIDLLPVFCVFCCYEKDCITNKDGSISIRLSDEIKGNIISHFPKADAVAVIKNPDQFISDIVTSIGSECKSGLVNYFHLTGLGNEQEKVNDHAYFMYLSQDTPPVKSGNKTTYLFMPQYGYRALLCKDVFFTNEQEYRFLLPNINIVDGKEFSVDIQEAIDLYDLKTFFGE